jgi:predicted PurR-regulated permease PerM
MPPANPPPSQPALPPEAPSALQQAAPHVPDQPVRPTGQVAAVLEHPWVKVLLIATAIAMATLALEETASITRPIAEALRDVLVPVAIGFAVAYVLTPVVDAIARQGGMRRLFAVGTLFGVASLLLTLTVVIVVPLVIRDGAGLVSRVFVGEPFTDLNHNGVYDPGEPFIDSNHNGKWDPGLLTAGLQWLEKTQEKMRERSHPALDDTALAFVLVYHDDLAADSTYLDSLVAAATRAAPVTQWPAMPADIAPLGPGVEASFGWPAPAAATIEAAVANLPADLRPRWRQLAASADAALILHHQALCDALVRARGGERDAEPILQNLHDRWDRPLTADDRKDAAADLAPIANAAANGEPNASHLLDLMHNDETSTVGSQALAALTQQLDQFVKQALQNSPANLGNLAQNSLDHVGMIFEFLLDAILVPIYAFFIILAMPAIRRNVVSFIPLERRPAIVKIVHDIERVVAAFFRGRLTICVICSLIGWLGFTGIWLFTGVNVPFSLFFAVAIGFGTAVPLSGIIFLVPAAALTVMQNGASGWHALAVLGVYAVVQMTEAILIPLIMGREVELHPVILLIALLLCGKLLGVLGLVLAVPIAATVRILAREYLWPRLHDWANRLPLPLAASEQTPPDGMPAVEAASAPPESAAKP